MKKRLEKIAIALAKGVAVGILLVGIWLIICATFVCYIRG